jgi:membrane-bound ClpP family serine protease
MTKSRKGYTIFTIATTLVEEAALAMAVLLGLPLLGISIPWWGVALMMTCWVAYSYVIYRLCLGALQKKALVGLETLIGAKGKAAGQIAPEGYVRVQGELWKARSTYAHVDEKEEVIVVGLSNRTLLVVPSGETHGSGANKELPIATTK